MKLPTEMLSLLTHINFESATKTIFDVRKVEGGERQNAANAQMFKPEYFKLDSLVDALFLTFLGVLGGFIGGGIASKSIQRLIAQSAVVKNVILFLLIWFTSSFTSDGAHEGPAVHFVQAVMLYVLLVLLMKTVLPAFVVAAFLLLANYITRKQIAYMDAHDLFFQANGSDELKQAGAKKRQMIILAQDCLAYASLVSIVIGVGFYMSKQIKDKGGSFNVFSFFLGANQEASTA